MKKAIEKIIGRIPRVGAWRDVFLKHSVPGQWGSPIPDWDDMKAKHTSLFNPAKPLPAVDMHADEQKMLCNAFKAFVPDFYETYVKKAKEEKQLFNLSGNIYYRYYDGANLFAYMRHFRPRRIIEIGSGYSSALMLDVNRQYFNNSIELTFIEPNPERLLSLVPDRNSIRLIQKNVQDVDPSVFASLEENDFLFVDSSHIAKMDSDLNKIILEILPSLRKGVHIHFHDITFPFEYPIQVIENRMAWNEAYFLQAFLMYNHVFTIEFMNTWLAQQEQQLFNDTFKAGADLPDFDLNYGGACWLKKQS